MVFIGKAKSWKVHLVPRSNPGLHWLDDLVNPIDMPHDFVAAGQR